MCMCVCVPVVEGVKSACNLASYEESFLWCSCHPHKHIRYAPHQSDLDDWSTPTVSYYYWCVYSLSLSIVCCHASFSFSLSLSLPSSFYPSTLQCLTVRPLPLLSLPLSLPLSLSLSLSPSLPPPLSLLLSTLQENVVWEWNDDKTELSIYQNLICQKHSQAVSTATYVHVHVVHMHVVACMYMYTTHETPTVFGRVEFLEN